MLAREAPADADVVVSAQCNRVPVIDGHTEAASVRLARPASPEEVAEALRALVDDLVCLVTPRPFVAVGAHYRDFGQVPDDAVTRMLAGQSRGG
jgi:predicted phosphoribosyltransferase